jgi:hypothetical protein
MRTRRFGILGVDSGRMEQNLIIVEGLRGILQWPKEGDRRVLRAALLFHTVCDDV